MSRDPFTADDFEKGGWATRLLNTHLAKTPVLELEGWKCTWKIWRGN